jgi:integrase
LNPKRTHQPGKLAAIALKKLADGWHADGGNLYLFVRGNSRTWVFRYVGGDSRRKNMGLGSLDSVPLAEARRIAVDLRAKIKHPIAPIDPMAERQSKRTESRLAKAKAITFKSCASAYIEAHRAGWKNAKHGAQWENTLSTYVHPVLGELPVASIDTALVMQVLEPIWTSKTETASRVRGRIESVLDWAAARRYREGENPARWRGHLDKLLAKPSKVAKVTHHDALPYADINSFMENLRAREGMGARALEFLILTAARSGEVRNATWDEIDLTQGVWVLPPDRMKAGKEHRVPLSKPALKLLNTLPRLDDCPLLFPSSKQGRPLSDMTLTSAIRRMEYTGVTAHGFRSTFRDWAAEKTTFPSDMAEMALAHTVSNKVEAAYRRGDMFEKRRKMMEAWARWCSTATGRGTVVPFKEIA